MECLVSGRRGGAVVGSHLLGVDRPRVMDAREIVLAYVANLGLCLDALRNHFDSVSRTGPTEPLVGRSALGDTSRTGRIEGVGVYTFHGAGCRFELDTGEEVDFDWNGDGDAIFDAWRLRNFARSRNDAGNFGAAELADAAGELVSAGVLAQVQDGWFRVHR